MSTTSDTFTLVEVTDALNRMREYGFTKVRKHQLVEAVEMFLPGADDPCGEVAKSISDASGQ